MHPFQQLFFGTVRISSDIQAVNMLFQRAECLHKGTLKIITDAHDLSGGLHLCRQCPLSLDKFVKGQTRYLDDTVIQRRFKAGEGLPSDGIRNLIQRIAQGDLRGHLRDGISRRLRSKGRGAADPGIYLDHTVFKAIGMQGKLYVAAPRDVQFSYNVQGGGTQHLVFLICQRLGGRHNDTIAGMDPHRIDIFHITYRNAVSTGIPHHLIFNLLPSSDTALDQALTHPAQAQPVGTDIPQFFFVMGDTAPASPQGIGRTDHHGITNLCGKFHRMIHGLHHDTGRNGFPNLFHGFLKFLTVFRLPNRLSCSADQPYILLFQKTGLFQLHGDIQCRLSTQRGKDTVGLFLFDQPLNHIRR